MKHFFSAKNLCLSGIIAALYAGLTLLLQPLSFGPMQLRVSEAMTLLPILTPTAIPGLTLGCFIANLIGSTWQDWVFGTLATLIAALLTRHFGKKLCLPALRKNSSWKFLDWKNICLGALMPVLSNGLIVGVMLYFLFGGSWIYNILTVGAGEAIACFALGIPLIRALILNRQIERYLDR